MVPSAGLEPAHPAPEAGALSTELRGLGPESSNRPVRDRGSYPFPNVSPRVLVVDDEPVLRRLLELNLRAAGFEVRMAASGRGALAEAAAVPPDAVVLDLGLPDLEGAEVVRRLRELPGSDGVPVVVLSGSDRDARAAPGYPSGVFAHLTKPTDPAAVVEAIRRAVGTAG